MSETIGNNHPDMEALLHEPALLAAVEALLGGAEFDRALYKRPQVLFTLPNSDLRTVPTGWHVDTPRLASDRRPGVQLFTFLDSVAPRGGGTLVLAGSHLLLNAGRFIRVKEIRQRLCREPILSNLEMVELTGAPGDVYLVDLRVLHTAAPNASDRPRMMATHRFVRADVIPELAAGYGWSHPESP